MTEHVKEMFNPVSLLLVARGKRFFHLGERVQDPLLIVPLNGVSQDCLKGLFGFGIKAQPEFGRFERFFRLTGGYSRLPGEFGDFRVALFLRHVHPGGIRKVRIIAMNGDAGGNEFKKRAVGHGNGRMSCRHAGHGVRCSHGGSGKNCGGE